MDIFQKLKVSSHYPESWSRLLLRIDRASQLEDRQTLLSERRIWGCSFAIRPWATTLAMGIYCREVYAIRKSSLLPRDSPEGNLFAFREDQSAPSCGWVVGSPNFLQMMHAPRSWVFLPYAFSSVPWKAVYKTFLKRPRWLFLLRRSSTGPLLDPLSD